MGLDPPLGMLHAVAQGFQYRAIGFMRVTTTRADVLVRRLNGELSRQLVEFALIKPVRHPARQQAGLMGDGVRDAWVTIAVAPHPGAEMDRHAIERQAPSGVLPQRAGQAAGGVAACPSSRLRGGAGSPSWLL